MKDKLHVVCAECGADNRVPGQRLHDRPKCGRCKGSLLPGRPVELTDDTFQRFLAKTDLPVIVDFWAPWCGPCKMMAPAFAEAAAELAPGVVLAKLNTQDWPQSAAPLNITGIPTMILFQGGSEVDRVSGAMDAAHIVQWVRSAATSRA